MTDYKSRFLKKLCLYENGEFLEIDFTLGFVSEEEADFYLSENSGKQIPIEFKTKLSRKAAPSISCLRI
jgi:hypothetical protein